MVKVRSHVRVTVEYKAHVNVRDIRVSLVRVRISGYANLSQSRADPTTNLKTAGVRWCIGRQAFNLYCKVSLQVILASTQVILSFILCVNNQVQWRHASHIKGFMERYQGGQSDETRAAFQCSHSKQVQIFI